MAVMDATVFVAMLNPNELGLCGQYGLVPARASPEAGYFGSGYLDGRGRCRDKPGNGPDQSGTSSY